MSVLSVTVQIGQVAELVFHVIGIVVAVVWLRRVWPSRS